MEMAKPKTTAKTGGEKEAADPDGGSKRSGGERIKATFVATPEEMRVIADMASALGCSQNAVVVGGAMSVAAELEMLPDSGTTPIDQAAFHARVEAKKGRP
jgi:hypothetical protein